jgi:hypothetical protein
MDDQRTDRESRGGMTPRNLFAVALAYLAATFLAGFVAMILAPAIGPFSSLIIAIILFGVAAATYRKN